MIDFPGLDEATDKDIENMKTMVATVKNETPFLKLFAIVLNGNNRAGQKSFLETIACFE